MPNYQNSKIYKLWSDQSDCFYIGSTTQNLAMRLSEHRSRIKLNATTTNAEMSNHTNIRIELIEAFPCNNKDELRAREGYYIRLHRKDILNKRMSGRSRVEYDEENKDEIRAYQKSYRESNKDTLKAYTKLYREANKEMIKAKNAVYYEVNKGRILDRQAVYREANRDVINARERDRQLANRNAINARRREKRAAKKAAAATDI